MLGWMVWPPSRADWASHRAVLAPSTEGAWLGWRDASKPAVDQQWPQTECGQIPSSRHPAPTTPSAERPKQGKMLLLLNDPVRGWVLPGAAGNGWVTWLSCQAKEQAPSSPW